MFPFLIFAATLIGIMSARRSRTQIIDALFGIAPDARGADAGAGGATRCCGKQSGGVLTLSALFAIWVASNAVEAFRIAFDRAYQVDDPRHFVEEPGARPSAWCFVGAVVAALLGLSIILSPLLLHLAERGPASADAAGRPAT